MSDYPMLISNKLHSFRNFSMQDSQDFQYLIPRIFNLFRFFNLSIIMRNFVELSDILQNAATGVN